MQKQTKHKKLKSIVSSKTVYCVVCDTSNKFISCFMTQTLVDAMRSTSLHTRFDSEIFPIFSASHVGKIVYEFMNFLPCHFSFSEGEFGEKFDYLSLLLYIEVSLTALYRCEFEVKFLIFKLVIFIILSSHVFIKNICIKTLQTVLMGRLMSHIASPHTSELKFKFLCILFPYSM